MTLSKRQWEIFSEIGYLKLGKLLSDTELEAMLRRVNQIMLGQVNVDYDRLLMVREDSRFDTEIAEEFGYKGPTLSYRIVENLEYDSLFLSFMKRPLFRHIAETVYGKRRVSSFKASYRNNPYASLMPFHQDRWQVLEKDPQITIVTALDPITRKNGCLKILPGTHRMLLNPQHPAGVLTQSQTDSLLQVHQPVYLELQAGESVLLHNRIVYGSDGNDCGESCRTFSFSFTDADVTKDGRHLSVVFGDQ